MLPEGEGGPARLRAWPIFVAAVAVVAALVAGTGTASAGVLFSDGFEAGDFSAWTLVKTGGGSAAVQSTIVKSGSYAAELSESSASRSKAYVRKALASSQVNLTARGDFQVLQQGASGGNVPFFRFFTGGGTRIISLYRQNVSGKIQVGYGGGNFATGAKLALSTWANLRLHVVIARTASTVKVSMNGTLLYSTTSASLGTAAAASIQLGNERAAQAFTLVADNITAQTSNTRSVVALWHMDETSGTTMFDSAGQNNGTLHSVTLGQPGFSGFAYGFNGSSSYVSVPSADSMNPGGANFSFTIALKTMGTPPPPPDDWDLIRKGDYTTAGGEYKMEFQRSGQASCGFNGSISYAEIQAGSALNDGDWHTITCVKTSSDIELIVDGQTFSTPATIGSISNTAPVTIGTHPGADWYKGSLDEATISIGF